MQGQTFAELVGCFAGCAEESHQREVGFMLLTSGFVVELSGDHCLTYYY